MPPVWAWSLAWGVMGICLYLSGVFNSPRTGPLWAALLGGMIPWALAGAFTFTARENSKVPQYAAYLIWALAYLLSFGLAALAGSFVTMGFLLISFAIGPGVGAFTSAILEDASRPGRAALAAAIWFVGFLAGTWVGFAGLYLLPELAKYLIGPLVGVPFALTLGSGLGAALGGLIAAGIAIPLTRRVLREEP